MPIKEKDIKLLWGRAAGRCSYTGCFQKLTDDKKKVSESYVLGEQAHIVAEENDGPRGRSILTSEQRNSYSNLILLCPTHHTIIDKNVDDHPVEFLHDMKRLHEEAIENSAFGSDRNKEICESIYARMMDMAVEKCSMENWKSWVGALIGTYGMISCKKEMINNIQYYCEFIYRAIWPNVPNMEFKLAVNKFSKDIHGLMTLFTEHVKIEDDYYIDDKFYQLDGNYNENYEKDFEEYENWVNSLYEQAVKATKSANWMSDVYRRDMNPMFFIDIGYLTIQTGDILSLKIELHKYTENEISEIVNGNGNC